ncbi:MAG: type IIL restriction-modification enzyme MmeI [Tepidisphaerales bacterium]
MPVYTPLARWRGVRRNRLVYNNFPWPGAATDKQRAKVEALAQHVLDLRVECGDGRVGFLPALRTKPTPNTLADLYDPLVMPAKLVKPHAELDRAVDACYRSQRFESERQRVEYLFALYEKLVAPLTAAATPKRGCRRATGA